MRQLFMVPAKDPKKSILFYKNFDLKRLQYLHQNELRPNLT